MTAPVRDAKAAAARVPSTPWRKFRQRLFARPYSKVAYVIERKGWSIDWDGRYITEAIRRQARVDCRVAASARGLKHQVVHFGSRHLYFSAGAWLADRSNRVIVTWFHGSDADPHPENQRMIRMLPEHLPRLERVVTASKIVEARLLRWGVPAGKIARIPLGVDLSMFRPASSEERRAARERLDIPEHAVCVGSFQKDGNGWGEGLEPKLVKGPDVLLDVVGGLTKRHPVFVLLLGPARGYVRRGLTARGIPFRHAYLRDYPAIAPYYHALDLYLVTSRDEGGPKTVLEAMASGVPVVSTRVGMAA